MPRRPKDSGQESAASRIAHMLGTYFFRLLGVNMLFLIACVPVVTIPAACCGLHSVVQRYYREIHSTTVTREFFREFKADFLQRTVICFLSLGIPMLIALLVGSRLSSTFRLVLFAVMFLAGLIVLTWFVPQLVYLNLRPLQALKNALIFTMIETKTNFFLMALHAVVLTVMVFGLPLSGFFLLFLPVLHAILVTGLVMPVLKDKLAQDEQPDASDEA